MFSYIILPLLVRLVSSCFARVKVLVEIALPLRSRRRVRMGERGAADRGADALNCFAQKSDQFDTKRDGTNCPCLALGCSIECGSQSGHGCRVYAATGVI